MPLDHEDEPDPGDDSGIDRPGTDNSKSNSGQSDGPVRDGSASSGDISAALEAWRNGLVNLNGRNRLINFKRTRTGQVEIFVTPDHIVKGLQYGAEQIFVSAEDDAMSEDDLLGGEPAHPPAVSGDAGPHLQTRLDDQNLGASLRRLMRKSKQEYLDRGVSVLYVAVGLLHWLDEDSIAYASPILLLPVELTSSGPRDVPRLRPSDEDPVVNPALTLRLRELGVELPTVDALAELDLNALWRDVEEAFREHDNWGTDESVILSCFTFQKEAMYRDLLENAALVEAHPIVRALATSDHTRQTAAFDFAPIVSGDIDQVAPPEEVPLVLDADSSQRACIAAATAGHSFVMDGPPGTGKSQTIANMIGALLHEGKRVLFVSEKAAALEVVRNRLADVGLDSYLLELHSHKASRREVALALAAALDNEPIPPRGMDPTDRRSVRERRLQLTGFADAMNRIRDPLGYSLHDVLGHCAGLVDVPIAPSPEMSLADLSSESLSRVRDAAEQLRRAWRPALQQATFLWRDTVDRDPLSGRVHRALEALGVLEGVVAVNQPLARAFGLVGPDDATVLAQLLDYAACRPPDIGDDWLTAAALQPIELVIGELGRGLDAVRRAGEAVRARGGVAWTALPVLPDLGDVLRLHHLTPPAVDLWPMTAPYARWLAERFSAEAGQLERDLVGVEQVAGALGLPSPVTFADAARVAAVAECGHRSHQPEPTWFAPGAALRVRAAAESLRACVERLVTAETTARRYFTPNVVGGPIEELADRFVRTHRGIRKLFGAYRADKQMVAELTLPGASVSDAIAHLSAAVAWKQALHDYAAAERSYAGLLGRYWNRVATDFGAVTAALETVDEVLRIVPPDAVPRVTDYVCGAAPNEALMRLAADAQAGFVHWQGTLRSAPEPAGRPELGIGGVRDAVTWLRSHLAPLYSAADAAAAFSTAIGREIDLAEVDALSGLRSSAAAAEAALTARAGDYQLILGQLYRGILTDELAVTRAFDWARTVRQRGYGGDTPLRPEQARELAMCRPTEGLTARAAAWQATRDAVVQAFAESRHHDLTAELRDYDGARGLLEDLRDDGGGQEEWFSYLSACTKLAEFSLQPAVEFCAERRVEPDLIWPVLRGAMLRAWADEVIRTDEALSPIRAQDRQQLVEDFRRLDLELINAAVGTIIGAVNTRRPPAWAPGGPTLIRREGLKKTRHLAVRRLLADARDAALALKPCFMMSPLAVSQFLPPDIEFDVVIFDEASQVTPGDAVNCIYRGKALITAGDDKQLPPTAFFERLVDEEDEDAETDVRDFPSILELSKACGAFRNLGLTWHYRSRHEALIAFSNHAFYRGRLITFPGANAEGPDVGVELLHVEDGIYRRGTTRDNPAEAEVVAERVVHHFTTRPDLSLGVVTFSIAQEQTIQAAVDRAVAVRPELLSYFDEDRLNGFFVKSLEAVQGDERDVMIFSIGYGYDEHRQMTANFGALNRAKGWRRLNVAITRARQRVEIVSSIRTGDVPATNNESVQFLIDYLDYAERGMAALTWRLGGPARDTESPFEDSVLDAVRSWGYEVTPQVGAAAYRIDLGVRHPDYPGEVYALGIECDGAMYHSSQAARDRDRLREQILRGLGWNLHRIWGTAWYRNRVPEENRLRAAIESAVTAPVSGRLVVPELERPSVEMAPVVSSGPPIWTRAYHKAALDSLPPYLTVYEVDMVPAIERIASVEGPVHISLVHQRLREAWDIGRIGNQIRSAIEQAIGRAHVNWDGTFLCSVGSEEDVVRTRGDGVTRTVEQVSDVELMRALWHLAEDGGAVPESELSIAVSRLFGWARRGPDIDARLTQLIEALINVGRLDRRPEGLRSNPW